MRALHLFLFLMLAAAAPAQVDSLLVLLNDAQHDSVRIKLLLEISDPLQQNDPPRAIEYATEALNLARKNGLKLQEGHACTHIGLAHRYTGELPEAYDFYLKALAIYEALGAQKYIAGAYSNIGVVHWLLNENDKALEKFEQAYEVLEALADSAGMAATLQNMGIQNAIRGKLQEARKLFLRAYDIHAELNDHVGMAKSLNNLSRVYMLLGELDKALETSFEATNLKHEIGDQYGEVLGMTGTAEIYREMNRPGEAIRVLNEALPIAEKMQQVESLVDIYDQLSKAYASSGKFAEAHRYQTEFIRWRDSMVTKNNHLKVAEIESKFEAEKKQRLIESLEHDKTLAELQIARQESVRNYIIGGVVLLILVMGLLFNRYKLGQEKEKTQLELENLDNEQRLLRAQMNPHFIFNSLNSIQSFITENEALIAARYLSKFARLMRNILEHTSRSRVPLSEEIETLELYLELEQLRFENKFEYELNVAQDIHPEDVEIPPMITQPFIENALLHGIRHKQGPGKIKVGYTKHKGLIECTVTDDGVGRERARQLKAARGGGQVSRGMQVTRDRLQRMRNDTGLPAGITFNDRTDAYGQPAGTEVKVRFPYEDF